MLYPFATDIKYGSTDLGLSHLDYAEENNKSSSMFIVRTNSQSLIEPDYTDTLRFYNSQCGMEGIPVVAVDLQSNQGVTEVRKFARELLFMYD